MAWVGDVPTRYLPGVVVATAGPLVSVRISDDPDEEAPYLEVTATGPAQVDDQVTVAIGPTGRAVIVNRPDPPPYVPPTPVPWAMAAGSVVVNLSAANSGTTAVTFPAGRFSAVPIVTATMAAGSASYVAGVGSVTASGFNAIAFQKDTATGTVALTVHWHAIQMTSSSGGG
jgi:hypothetical protein